MIYYIFHNYDNLYVILYQVLGTTNNEEILVLVWILNIAYAKIGAKESLFSLPSVN